MRMKLAASAEFGAIEMNLVNSVIVRTFVTYFTL